MAAARTSPSRRSSALSRRDRPWSCTTVIAAWAVAGSHRQRDAGGHQNEERDQRDGAPRPEHELAEVEAGPFRLRRAGWVAAERHQLVGGDAVGRGVPEVELPEPDRDRAVVRSGAAEKERRDLVAAER